MFPKAIDLTRLDKVDGVCRTVEEVKMDNQASLAFQRWTKSLEITGHPSDQVLNTAVETAKSDTGVKKQPWKEICTAKKSSSPMEGEYLIKRSSGEDLSENQSGKL